MRRASILVACSLLLPSAVTLVASCKRYGKDARAREMPVASAVDDGLESRFRLREMSLGGCAVAACARLVATDAETGNQIVVSGLEMPEHAPNAEALRARALGGELLVVGAVNQRFRADTIQGKSTPPDAGANDRLFYARDTVSPTSGDAEKPTPLALYSCPGTPQSTVKIVLDGPDVYFAGCDFIQRVPKAGGQAMVVAEEPMVRDFVVDDAFVYWWSFRAFGLVKTPKDGGPMVVLAPASGPHHLVLDGSDLYYLRGVYQKDTTEIVRQKKTGGDVFVIASTDDFVSELAVDATNVYVQVTTRAGTVQSIASVKKSGGPLTTVVTAGKGGDPTLVNPTSLHVSGDRLYWTSASGMSPIASAPKRGGSINSQVYLDNTLADALAIAGDDLYATSYDHRAFRATKDGPTIHFLQRSASAGPTGTHTRSDIAVDDKYIYWMQPLAPASLSLDVLTRQPR